MRKENLGITGGCDKIDGGGYIVKPDGPGHRDDPDGIFRRG